MCVCMCVPILPEEFVTIMLFSQRRNNNNNNIQLT